MPTRIRLLRILAVCCGVAGGLVAQSASAQVMIVARPAHVGYWGCWSIRYVDDRPLPYYAAHPPVYYSGQITPRPYGAVPFAYLPGVVYPHSGYSQYQYVPTADQRGPVAERQRSQWIYPTRQAPETSGVRQRNRAPGDRPGAGHRGGASAAESDAVGLPRAGDGKVLRVSNPFYPGKARRKTQWQIGSRTVERVHNPFVAGNTPRSSNG